MFSSPQMSPNPGKGYVLNAASNSPGCCRQLMRQRLSPLHPSGNTGGASAVPHLSSYSSRCLSALRRDAALNEAPQAGAEPARDHEGNALWWFEGWREKTEQELKAALDAEAAARTEYSEAADRASELRSKAQEAGNTLNKAAASTDWKARLDAGRVASGMEKDAKAAEALLADLGEVLNEATLRVASARETCAVASVALAGQKEDAGVKEAEMKGVRSNSLASDNLPWFEDWNRRAEEELQAALDAEATIKREHEAAAERVSQLLNKADEAESALKKAAAGVDWKARLEAGRMASAADKVTKQAEEELTALNTALSEASSRVQSAEETRRVAAATLGELRALEQDAAPALTVEPKLSQPAEGQHSMAASGLGLDLEQLNLQVLSPEPDYAKELEQEKHVYSELMAELERAMQECAAAEEELLKELEQLKAERLAAKGSRQPQC